MNVVNKSWIAAAVVTGLVTAASITGFAQYTIGWYTINGGGGVSTGGDFAMKGTIGRLDAGASMAGGDFSVTGGFWTILAIQTPEAPFLRIEPAGPGLAMISWDPSQPGWILQEATNLVETNWINRGETNPVAVPTSTNPTFFRLFRR